MVGDSSGSRRDLAIAKKNQLSSFGDYVNSLHNSHSVLEIRVCLTAMGH